jgi:hypothetical protein
VPVRMAWVAMFTVLVGLVVPSVTRGGTPPPPGVGPVDPSPRQIPPCRPKPSLQCLLVAETGSAPSTALLAAGDRRGLGISRPVAIVGAKKARRLRAQFLAGLTTPRVKTPASRGVQSPHAAPGGVIRESVLATGSARRGRAGVLWRYRLEAEIERCPDPGRPGQTYGDAWVTVQALYLIQTMEVRRGRLVITDITLAMRTRQHAAWVDRKADLRGVGFSGGRPGTGNPPGSQPAGERIYEVTVTRSARVVDSSGQERDLGRATTGFDVNQFSPEVHLVTPDTFGEWIAQQEARERSEPSPDADGPLLGPAWRQLAAAFTRKNAQHLARLARAAERHWRTPGACVALDLDGPSSITRGGTTQIKGRPRSSARPVSPTELLGFGTFRAQVVRGATLRSLIESLPIPPDKNWVEYRAPAENWTAANRPGASVTFTSTAGIGEATKLFDPQDPVLYFRVLAASYQEDFLGQGDPPGSICALAGVSTGFSQRIQGTMLAPAFEPTNRVEFAEDGSALGQIGTTGDGTVTGTMNGCDILTLPPPACNQPYSGPFQVAPAIVITITPNASEANIDWPFPPLGPNIPGGNPACTFAIPRNLDTVGKATRTLPVSTLMAPGDHTVTLSHARMGSGPGVSVSSTVSASITFRRVREDGTAL